MEVRPSRPNFSNDYASFVPPRPRIPIQVRAVHVLECLSGTVSSAVLIRIFCEGWQVVGLITLCLAIAANAIIWSTNRQYPRLKPMWTPEGKVTISVASLAAVVRTPPTVSAAEFNDFLFIVVFIVNALLIAGLIILAALCITRARSSIGVPSTVVLTAMVLLAASVLGVPRDDERDPPLISGPNIGQASPRSVVRKLVRTRALYKEQLLPRLTPAVLTPQSAKTARTLRRFAPIFTFDGVHDDASVLRGGVIRRWLLLAETALWTLDQRRSLIRRRGVAPRCEARFTHAGPAGMLSSFALVCPSS